MIETLSTGCVTPLPGRHDDAHVGGKQFQQESPVKQSAPVVARVQEAHHSTSTDLTAGHHPAKGTVLGIGSYSTAGNRYGTLNQDYVVVQEMYAAGEIPAGGQQTWIAAICDGHGVLGDKSASFAGKALARYIYSGGLRNKKLCKLPSEELEKEMKAAFRKAHVVANTVYDAPPKTISYPVSDGDNKKLAQYTLCEEGGVRLYRHNGRGPEKLLECGTTCTAVVLQGRCVCLADVGDSISVLGYDDGERYRGQVVTVRHHGLNEEEAVRIRTQHADTTRILEDGYIQVFDGPWAGYELSVTRALGHKHMQAYGVMDEPYVSMLSLESKHCCLVLASDGVWDHLSPDEAISVVMDACAEGKSAQQAARELVEHAVDLGLNSPDGEADNTSAVVIFFDV